MDGMPDLGRQERNRLKTVSFSPLSVFRLCLPSPGLSIIQPELSLLDITVLLLILGVFQLAYNLPTFAYLTSPCATTQLRHKQLHAT